MSCLLKNFRRHIPRRTARCGQHVELLLIHNTREAKVGNQQVGVILGGPEQQILGLEVAVYDAVVMEVRNGGQRRPDQVSRIALVVAAFAADAVEEFATESEFGNEVDYFPPQSALFQGQISVGREVEEHRGAVGTNDCSSSQSSQPA